MRSVGLGALYTSATLRPGATTADVEALIYEEIERLKKEPIADWELQKAKIRRAAGSLMVCRARYRARLTSVSMPSTTTIPVS